MSRLGGNGAGLSAMTAVGLAALLVTIARAQPPPEGEDEGTDGVAASATPTGEKWTYGEAAEWGRSFPTCDGRVQSPINLDSKCQNTTDEVLGLVKYRALKGWGLKNNGKTLQVDGAFGTLELPGGMYDVLQFHVHFPSEHTVDGRLAAGELHIVHKRRGAPGLAVVGVFLDLGPDDNPFLAGLGFATRELPKKGTTMRIPGTVDLPTALAELFRGDAFHYTGSLTTPPCTEGVSWYVLERRLTVSPAQVAQFKRLFPDPANNRPLQELNGRPVVCGKVSLPGEFTHEEDAIDGAPTGRQSQERAPVKVAGGQGQGQGQAAPEAETTGCDGMGDLSNEKGGCENVFEGAHIYGDLTIIVDRAVDFVREANATMAMGLVIARLASISEPRDISVTLEVLEGGYRGRKRRGGRQSRSGYRRGGPSAATVDSAVNPAAATSMSKATSPTAAAAEAFLRRQLGGDIDGSSGFIRANFTIELPREDLIRATTVALESASILRIDEAIWEVLDDLRLDDYGVEAVRAVRLAAHQGGGGVGANGGGQKSFAQAPRANRYVALWWCLTCVASGLLIWTFVGLWEFAFNVKKSKKASSRRRATKVVSAAVAATAGAPQRTSSVRHEAPAPAAATSALAAANAAGATDAGGSAAPAAPPQRRPPSIATQVLRLPPIPMPMYPTPTAVGPAGSAVAEPSWPAATMLVRHPFVVNTQAAWRPAQHYMPVQQGEPGQHPWAESTRPR